MKQKLLKLMCLLCVSMMGVSAWGADVEGTISFGTQGVRISSASVTGDDDQGNEWTITTVGTTSFTANAYYHQVGSSSKPATSITFTTTLADDVNITSMEAKFGGFNSTAGTITMKVGDTTIGTGSLNATEDVTVKSSSTALGKVLTVTITNIAKGVKCYYISYTYTTGGASTPTCATPTFTYESGSILTGTEVEIATTTEGATIYYTTDGTNPSTSSNEYTGAITVNADMTIKAIAVKDSYDNSAIASVSYTVTSPITFNKVTNMNQLVAGNEYIVVCDAQNTAMGAQDNANYRTPVNAEINENTIVVDPTEVAILTLGGSVDAWTFCASDNDKYLTLTSANNYIQSADNASGAGALWSVTEDFELSNNSQSRTLRYNSGSPRFACYSSGQTAAYLYVKAGSPVGKNVADVAISTTALYVDGTATVTTDGPAVTLSTSDASVASVSGTTVRAEGTGTATITATWAESAEFQAGSKEFTITVLRVDGLSSAKAFTVAEAKAMIDNGYDSEATYYVDGIISKIDTYNDSYHSISYWISEDGSTTNQFECYGGLSFDGKGFTGKDNLTVGDEVTVKGKLNKHNTTYELNTNNELVYLRSTISVSASGYATYYNSGLAYVIPTGLTGYAITAAAGDQLTTTEYTAGFGVPAGEALVLKGAQGNYDLIFTTTDVAPNASNLLKGSDAAETPTADGKYYMLSYDATGANVGFYWGEDNGAAFENGAHKAYLLLPSATPVKGFRFDFDEATAITELTEKTEATEGVIYNLRGQRMNSLQRGINIVGGKKVLVK